jgi:hypothetical protein
VEDRDLQEIRSDLHDLYDVIASVGIELEAINMSVRALTAHLIGEDPLRNSLYYGGPAEEGPAPEPPAWVNAHGAGRDHRAADERLATPADVEAAAIREHLIREQNAGRGLGWVMIIAALMAVLTTVVILLWMI